MKKRKQKAWPLFRRIIWSCKVCREIELWLRTKIAKEKEREMRCMPVWNEMFPFHVIILDGVEICTTTLLTQKRKRWFRWFRLRKFCWKIDKVEIKAIYVCIYIHVFFSPLVSLNKEWKEKIVKVPDWRWAPASFDLFLGWR